MSSIKSTSTVSPFTLTLAFRGRNREELAVPVAKSFVLKLRSNRPLQERPILGISNQKMGCNPRTTSSKTLFQWKCVAFEEHPGVLAIVALADGTYSNTLWMTIAR